MSTSQYTGTSGPPPRKARSAAELQGYRVVKKETRDGAAARGIGFTFRDHGNDDVNFAVPCNRNSHVVASLSEINPVTGEPFIGAASMDVHNVSPGDGFCFVRL